MTAQADSSLTTFDTDTDGDWAVWDRIWKTPHRYEERLYRAGEPQTLRELLHQTYFEDLWQLLGQTPSRCVELGAGRGTMSMYLSQHGCDVTLVDLSVAGLQTAAKNFAEERLPRPTIVVADARDSNLPSASYDCVCSTGLLEHFHDPRPVLAESLRLLQRGGVIYHIIVPDTNRLRSIPLRGSFNPWEVAVRELKQWMRPLLKAPFRPRGALRTYFPQNQWVSWLQELQQAHAVCLPYNPLHSFYRWSRLERVVTLPIWRAHLARRRRCNMHPLLGTSESLAQCQLLVCRKE